MHYRAPKRLPHVLGEQHRVLRATRRFSQCLDDRCAVTNRYSFAQQVLQHFLDRCQRKQFGDQIFHRARMIQCDAIAETLGILAREELVRLPANNLGQVRDENANRVDYRVPGPPCRVPLISRNPERRQPERGFRRTLADD